MNINTNKLASSSNSFLKKLKETSGLSKSDKNDEKIKTKLLDDFFDVKVDNRNFKGRLVNNSKRLSAYEHNLSELQFISEKLKEIEQFKSNNDIENIEKIISESLFDDKYVLREHFEGSDSLNSQIEQLNSLVKERFYELDREFRAIEIASQNILSINSFEVFNTEESNVLANLDMDNLMSSTSLDNKRVLELIS